jgi:ABC-2 type transport system permease protein
MILRGFLKKEIIQMLRNPVMVFALLFMPIVQSFLFSYAITNEPKNIKIAIDTAPSDYMMTRIYDHAIASKWFLKIPPTRRGLFEVVKAGKADVVLVAPPGGLTKNVVNGNKSEIQVLIDSTNVLKAQAVSGYIRAIVAKVLKEEMGKRDLLAPANAIPQNINFKTRILFNPEMNTKMFIVPSVMVIMAAMSILSLVCISIAKEKETGTMETLISYPIEKKHLMLGKILPAITIAFFNYLSIMLIGLLVFHIPFRGSLFEFLLSFFVFSFAMAPFGIFISTFCNNQQQALIAIMMAAFLMMMLSGSMFPVETMPFILRIFANIDPLTHFTCLARNIMLKGCNIDYLVTHLGPMIAFGLFFSVTGTKRFKQTL